MLLGLQWEGQKPRSVLWRLSLPALIPPNQAARDTVTDSSSQDKLWLVPLVGISGNQESCLPCAVKRARGRGGVHDS